MGGTSLTGIDQSWGQASKAAVRAAVKANGMFVVSMYLSHDTSKNMTAADIKRYLDAGAGMLFNWENQAGAPLQGAAQGRTDATEAVRQAKALLKAAGRTGGSAPKNRIVLYFSCDRDVTSGQLAKVAAYYTAARDVCHAAGFGVGAYGEADVIDHLAQHGITDAEWQTYAWSGGRLSPNADFYQYLNGQAFGGASVDLDRVIHPSELGALWPAGHKYDAAPGGTEEAHPLADLTKAQIDDLAEVVARKVLTLDAIPAPAGRNTKANPNWTLSSYLKVAHENGVVARDQAKSANSAITSVAGVVNTLLTRVAALQAAVNKVSNVVATLEPAKQIAVDTAAIATASADAVWAKVKALKLAVSA